MGKKRIYEFAKENNVTSKEVIAAAKKAGLTGIKSSMNSIDDNDASKVSAVLKDASTSSAAPKAAAKPVASAVPAKSAAAPASAAAKPSAEAKKPGTSHAQHKTADGKTLISRSAIRRPGTQNNHNATRNNHQATGTRAVTTAARVTTVIVVRMITVTGTMVVTVITTVAATITGVVVTTATTTVVMTTVAVTTVNQKHQCHVFRGPLLLQHAAPAPADGIPHVECTNWSL